MFMRDKERVSIASRVLLLSQINFQYYLIRTISIIFYYSDIIPPLVSYIIATVVVLKMYSIIGQVQYG